MPEHRPLHASDLLPRPLGRLGRALFLHTTIDSTNRFLLRHAQQVGDGAVAWAEYQSAGRGRRGRRWLAPRGSSVLLSVLLIEPGDAALHQHASLLGAVAACEAIAGATDCAPAIRWPNDLVLGGRKVGGVLAESCGLTDVGRRAVVIGVGINCLQRPEHFAGELRQRATSLECESPRPVDRAAVAATLLQRLDHWLMRVAQQPGGWDELRAVWHNHCHDFGQRVILEHDGRTFSGTAIDVAADGDLIVQLDHGGRRHFAAALTTRAW